MEPSAARRAVLVALQSLGPYCVARWAPAMPDREDNGSWRDDSPTEMTSAATGQDGPGGLPPLPHQRLWQQVSMSVCGLRCAMAKPLLTRKLWKKGATAAACKLQAVPGQVSRHAAEAWRWLNCYSGEAARLHLALFYIYGTYYEWPKRLAGEIHQHHDVHAVLTTCWRVGPSNAAASCSRHPVCLHWQDHGAARQLPHAGHPAIHTAGHHGKPRRN